MVVDLSGSVTIGGYTWTGGGHGFTHADLPGNSCFQSFTQFSLEGLTPPPDLPWTSDEPFTLGPPTTFVLSYRDLLIQDAFPYVPTTLPGRPFNSSLWNVGDMDSWTVFAALQLEAVNQPAPIPEPGTLTLLGIGLAAAARARKRK
jgi:hypothetical protein